MQVAVAKQVVDVPTGDLCLRVARELETLRQLGARLEMTLCSGADGFNLDAQRVRELQEFDVLIQHMAALRDFLSALGGLMPANASVDPTAALNRLGLGELKQRLAGGQAFNGAVDFKAVASGDCEMF